MLVDRQQGSLLSAELLTYHAFIIFFSLHGVCAYFFGYEIIIVAVASF